MAHRPDNRLASGRIGTHHLGVPVRRLTKQLDTLMLVLSLIFLIAYAIPIVWPNANDLLIEICDRAQVAIWLAFALELSYRFVLAKSRRHFLRKHWLDVLAVASPALRSLRLLRLVSTATLISRRIVALGGLRMTVAFRTATTALLLWLLAGLAVTDAEQGGQGSIQDVWDGWWWALTTMTTVGYGDFYPVTLQGRLVGAGLMILGIAILGIVTATIASWFVEQSERTDALLARESDEIASLKMQVVALTDELSKLKRTYGHQ